MQQLAHSILFLNLTTFSRTGGIEKFNKCLLKALVDVTEDKETKISSYSLYDSETNEDYFQGKNYRGFSGRQSLFVIKSILKAKAFDHIIIGHINIAIIGCLIKRIFPKKRVTLITHGIEVWEQASGFKKELLQKADTILTVSNYTSLKLQEVHGISKERIKVFHNTIDPYFTVPARFEKSDSLRRRYGLQKDDYVLFTLTRLSSAEKYKGYDIVIQCLPELLKTIPTLKYVIAGKYDEAEKVRVDALVKELSLEKAVIFAGYIEEAEVKDHFQMGDVFIMPSQGEGFGIVFIEAMVCGLPVIAGNQDGSVDALCNGELGTLVNPHSKEEITQKILEHYNNRTFWKADDQYKLQQKTLKHFGFQQYKEHLKNILATA